MVQVRFRQAALNSVATRFETAKEGGKGATWAVVEQ
jgi:hypothetical protein